MKSLARWRLLISPCHHARCMTSNSPKIPPSTFVSSAGKFLREVDQLLPTGGLSRALKEKPKTTNAQVERLKLVSRRKNELDNLKKKSFARQASTPVIELTQSDDKSVQAKIISKSKARRPKKRKKTQRKLGSKIAEEAKQSESTSPVSQLSTRREQFEDRYRSHWSGDQWTQGWGSDNLMPNSMEPVQSAESAPQSGVPLPYTRRVEGLIRPVGQSLLQGKPFRAVSGLLFKPASTDLTPLTKQKPVATLSHGLDRVLFNPGVYWLQDPRSKVFNFTPWLQNIPAVKDFAFEQLPGFIKSSRDEDLWDLARREKRVFGGSTSSLSGMLSHLYFLISEHGPVDTSVLSVPFQNKSTSFTSATRMPVSVLFNYKDGVYAIDSDSQEKSAGKNVLSWMGTMLEKMLTSTPEQFTSLMRSNQHAPKLKADEQIREAYRYSKSNRFVMRSQLDCRDHRLPGTGVFDIKTRAAYPVRLDMINHSEYTGYLLRTAQGPLESFEKEYYDLVRSAFLKYSFQARIGNMDGVFITYHNTDRIFGFQYVSLDEMDERLFGGKGRGERVFDKCISLLEVVADEIIHAFPESTLSCTFETQKGTCVTNVWIEPDDWPGSEKPIVQLDVTVTNFLGSAEVKGTDAMSEADPPWTLHWKIQKSSSNEGEIRTRLEAAKERQFCAYSLPTGVGIEEMAQRWHELDYSGQNTQGSLEAFPFNPDYFVKPGAHIESLRALSRSRREENEQVLDSEKVVWGIPLHEVHAEANSQAQLVGTGTSISEIIENAQASETQSEDLTTDCAASFGEDTGRSGRP